MRISKLGVGVAIGFAMVVGCSSATDPAAQLNGVYDLEQVSGNGPASGTLVLTRKGYAERRVRFLDEKGVLSREQLSRGTVVITADNTIEVEFTDIDPPIGVPWKSRARRLQEGVELTYTELGGVEVTVETWRRQ